MAASVSRFEHRRLPTGTVHSDDVFAEYAIPEECVSRDSRTGVFVVYPRHRGELDDLLEATRQPDGSHSCAHKWGVSRAVMTLHLQSHHHLGVQRCRQLLNSKWRIWESLGTPTPMGEASMIDEALATPMIEEDTVTNDGASATKREMTEEEDTVTKERVDDVKVRFDEEEVAGWFWEWDWSRPVRWKTGRLMLLHRLDLGCATMPEFCKMFKVPDTHVRIRPGPRFEVWPVPFDEVKRALKIDCRIGHKQFRCPHCDTNDMVRSAQDMLRHIARPEHCDVTMVEFSDDGRVTITQRFPV